MSETRDRSGVDVPRQTKGAREAPPEPTGWVGWVVFAGLIMIMVGTFQVIAGLVALFNDDYFAVGQNGLIVSVDYTAWGWVHLVWGIIVGLAGLALLAGQMWARVLAVLAAGVQAIVNLAFLSAHPVWTTIVIALDVLVIYAVVVHGRELKSSYQ